MNVCFIKVNVDGRPLPDDASEWVAVLDTTTHLVWSRGFVLPKEKRYKAAIEAASKFELLGLTGWRAPTLQERVAIADYGRTGPAIDTRYFDSPAYGWEWTATPYANSPGGYAWFVNFDGGNANWSHQYNEGFVRACRPSQGIGSLAEVQGR